MAVLSFYTLQTLPEVPYSALGAEITQDYDERASIGATRNVFYVFSMLISNIMMSVVVFFDGLTDNMELSWSITGGLYGILVIVSILIAFHTTKGYELVRVGDVQKFSPKNMFVEPFKNRTFRFVTGLFAFAIVGFSTLATTTVYYFLNVFKFDENQLSTLLVAFTLVGFVGVPWADFLSKKYSKKVSWIVSMSLWAAGFLIYPLFVFNYSRSMTALVGFIIVAGIGFNVLFQIIWSMIPDCVEVDEFKSGKRREGMYYGVISFTQKLCSAIAIALVGIVLEHIGYDATLSTQAPETLKGLSNFYGWGVVIPVIVALIIGALNPMTRERHSQLLNAIQRKRNNEAYPMEGLEKIL
ncbi:MAG: MFS transporter [Deltaproteobacteria bacterium]|nr:MFS transporter [Deltaproteobacteria bacterium]